MSSLSLSLPLPLFLSLSLSLPPSPSLSPSIVYSTLCSHFKSYLIVFPKQNEIEQDYHTKSLYQNDYMYIYVLVHTHLVHIHITLQYKIKLWSINISNVYKTDNYMQMYTLSLGCVIDW